MLLNDVIDIIKRIEDECNKEIKTLRFGELNPHELQEIIFVPEYYYTDTSIEENIIDNFKPGGTD